MFQPSTEWYKHHQHRGSLKERDRTGGFLHDHGHNDHHTGVHIGDGGGENNQHVHVGGAVSESFKGLDVEVSSSNKLKEIRRDVIYGVLFLRQLRTEPVQVVIQYIVRS